jgi:CheY-like chemotaxis protein
LKILVIEDEPVELKLASELLKTAGHIVKGAEAAEHAFAAIRDARPEIILLDLTLPGMDGLTLVRRLKADPTTRDISIVAVTSNPEMFTREEMLGAGCDAYLLKPLNTRTLPQTLSDVVVEVQS